MNGTHTNMFTPMGAQNTVHLNMYTQATSHHVHEAFKYSNVQQ